MDKATFYQQIKENGLFAKLTQKQVVGMDAIIDEIEAQCLTDRLHIAYIFATAYHETARTMEPVTEYGSKSYLMSKKYWPYVGRGFVQLTWDYNYKKYSKILGIDFITNPGLLLDAKTSAFILVHGMVNGVFTGKKLSDYKTFVSMRKIINGTDKAAIIAGYADRFLKSIAV